MNKTRLSAVLAAGVLALSVGGFAQAAHAGNSTSDPGGDGRGQACERTEEGQPGAPGNPPFCEEETPSPTPDPEPSNPATTPAAPETSAPPATTTPTPSPTPTGTVCAAKVGIPCANPGPVFDNERPTKRPVTPKPDIGTGVQAQISHVYTCSAHIAITTEKVGSGPWVETSRVVTPIEGGCETKAEVKRAAKVVKTVTAETAQTMGGEVPASWHEEGM